VANPTDSQNSGKAHRFVLLCVPSPGPTRAHAERIGGRMGENIGIPRGFPRAARFRAVSPHLDSTVRNGIPSPAGSESVEFRRCFSVSATDSIGIWERTFEASVTAVLKGCLFQATMTMVILTVE